MTTTQMQHISTIEQKIIRKLVAEIAKRAPGATAMIFTGDSEADWIGPIDSPDLFGAVGVSDLTNIVLRTADQQRGVFMLVHGNDEDVISDHSDNYLCNDIFAALGLA